MDKRLDEAGECVKQLALMFMEGNRFSNYVDERVITPEIWKKIQEHEHKKYIEKFQQCKRFLE